MLLNTNECILHLLYQALCGYISQCLKNKKNVSSFKIEWSKILLQWFWWQNDNWSFDYWSFDNWTHDNWSFNKSGLLTNGLLPTGLLPTGLLYNWSYIQLVFGHLVLYTTGFWTSGLINNWSPNIQNNWSFDNQTPNNWSSQPLDTRQPVLWTTGLETSCLKYQF